MTHDLLVLFMAIMWVAMNFVGANFAWKRVADRRATDDRNAVRPYSLLPVSYPGIQEKILDLLASPPRELAYFSEPPRRKSSRWLQLAIFAATLGVSVYSGALFKNNTSDTENKAPFHVPVPTPMPPSMAQPRPIVIPKDDNPAGDVQPIRRKTLRIPRIIYARALPAIPGSVPILSADLNSSLDVYRR